MERGLGGQRDPFTPDEVAVLRGMIDEYEYARRRRLLASQRWKTSRVVILSILGFTLYALQIVVALIAINHH